MADNKIANAIKFLKGEESSLPATKTEGQVYFAYKNVGTAEKPSYTGAIYIDTPIGGTQNRIKMTANADIADKAFNDSAGLSIRDTYLSSLGYTDDGKQTILIKGSGNNQTKIALPIASATKSGIVTTDAQSFGGTKTFVTINSTNLTISGSSGFNYTGIETATGNSARPVWFAYDGVNGKPVVNTNFTYNPATQTLNVNKITGTAAKATADGGGLNIANTYAKYNGFSFTAGSDNVVMKSTAGSGAINNSAGTIPAASESAAGVITTGMQTFSGDKKFNNTIIVNDHLVGNPMTGTDTTKLVLLSIPNAYIGDTSYTTSVYFKALLKWICQNYPNKQGYTFIGKVNPNSVANAFIHIYDTAKVDATSGLPEHSSGIYAEIGGNIYTFGTLKYAFYFRNSLMSDNKYAGSDSAGGAATSANKLNTNAGSASLPVYFSNGIPVACSTSLGVSITGNASTATALTSSAGSAIQPVYFSGGKPVACTYTLSKSVPSNAVFTDTNTWRPLGTTADTACAGNDSRLSNARPASDVYSWAKASSKPSYSWGEITGKPSTFAPSGHSHSSLTTIGDMRDTATTPNTYSNTLSFQGLKQNTTIGISDAGTYSYVLGLRGWSDSSGGNSHELAFNNNGIYTRSGATTSWGGWRTLIDSSNYTSYTVTKSGIGASGTWGINVSGSSASCTGNAATATKLQTARTISLTGSVTGSGSFDGSGNLSISTTTNHAHSYVLDVDGNSHTTFAYSKAGMGYGDYTWLAGWNGTELRAVNKSQFAQASHTHDYLPLSGGTITGLTKFTKGKNVFTSAPGSGTAGYGLVAEIKITASYQNEPIEISFARRADPCITRLSIEFQNANSADPALGAFRVMGATNECWIYKSATSTWNLYIKKAEIYDSIDILEYYIGNYMSGFSITWKSTLASSLPSGSTQAVWGYNVGYAVSAGKLTTARTISLTGAVTGSGSFDGSGNLTISTTPNHIHNEYLPLAGGTMTGSINFKGNSLACNFRSDSTGYSSGITHQTSGNEALVFAAANSVTSFMFKCGQTPFGMTSTTWQNITPSMQIKNQSVYINSLIANGVTPSYNLYVNGTTRCNGTLGVGNGSSAEIDFFPSSSSTIGAKIVAYSDRIEFVFA